MTQDYLDLLKCLLAALCLVCFVCGFFGMESRSDRFSLWMICGGSALSYIAAAALLVLKYL